MKLTADQVEDAIRDAKVVVERACVLHPLSEGDHLPLAFAMAFVSIARMYKLNSREMHSLVTAAYIATPKPIEEDGCTHPLMKRIPGDEFNPPTCLCGAKEYKPGVWS